MNLSGTLNALKLLYNIKLCKPKVLYPTFNDIPIPIADHIKAIVLDKDNCFAFPKQSNVWPEYREKWESIKKAYPGKRILIVSNTAGSSDDKDYKEAKLIESATGVAVLRHSTKKPGCYEEILKYFQNHKIIEHPSEIAVVGDRLFTDMVMANMMKSYGIWIKDGVVESNSPIIMLEKKIASYRFKM